MPCVRFDPAVSKISGNDRRVSNSVFKVKRLIQWCIDLVDVSLGVFAKKRFSRHRFCRKFHFNRKFEKNAVTKCGSSALQKYDLVENFDLIENSAVTDFSTKVVSLPHLVLTPATPL